MKRRKRAIQILAACGVLLAASAFLWRWLGAIQPQVCRLPDGSTMTLLGTTYGRHHKWTSRVRGQGLWAQLQWLLHPGSEVSELETPTDALVLWLKFDGARGIPLFFDLGSRIEVSDAAGNRQVIDLRQYPYSDIRLAAGTLPMILPTFPRRDKDLTVRYYRLHATYLRPEAVFHVDNPVPRNYPHWSPEPIPTTRTAGDLQVTLAGVSLSDQITQSKIFQGGAGGFGGSYGFGPKTKPWGTPLYGEERRVAAHLRVRGSPRAQWGISEMWVSDATGNIWQAADEKFQRYGMPILDMNYLTPANAETLRYTVECNRGTGAQFPAQDLWTLAAINIPRRGQRLPVGVSHGDQDLTLKLLGITGIGSTWAKPPASGVQPRQDTPVVYLEVTGVCQPYLYATDETGRHIQGGGGQNVADRWTQPDTSEIFTLAGNSLKPYVGFGPGYGTRILLYPLKMPPGSKRLNLTFAVNKTRTFEFTVPADAGLSHH